MFRVIDYISKIQLPQKNNQTLSTRTLPHDGIFITAWTHPRRETADQTLDGLVLINIPALARWIKINDHLHKLRESCLSFAFALGGSCNELSRTTDYINRHSIECLKLVTWVEAISSLINENNTMEKQTRLTKSINVVPTPTESCSHVRFFFFFSFSWEFCSPLSLRFYTSNKCEGISAPGYDTGSTVAPRHKLLISWTTDPRTLYLHLTSLAS